MSHDSQRDDGTDRQIDSAAVTEVLRDLRPPAADGTTEADGTPGADGPDGVGGEADGTSESDDAEQFLLADPDEPVVYVYEIPADGPLEHVDTLPIEAAETADRDEDGDMRVHRG